MGNKHTFIKLKIPTWDDMSFIRMLWSDPATMKPVGGSILLTDEQAIKWYARMIDSDSATDQYRLIFSEVDHPVGEVSFHRLDRSNMTAEFNIKIISTERGKRYGTEAMRLFLDYFFNQIQGRELIDDVALENHAGQRALLKFGFQHDSSTSEVFRLRMTREQYNSIYHGSGE